MNDKKYYSTWDQEVMGKLLERDKEIAELKKFVEHALAVIPYVRATVSPGNRFPGSRQHWCEVHEGRADSSVVQLDNLEREAMAIRALAPAATTEEP